MKTFVNLFLLLLVILAACESSRSEYDCEAIVIENVNNGIITCDKDVYNLKFTRGLEIVDAIISEDYEVPDSTFAAINLPDNLKIPGLQIELEVRAPEAGEGPVCHNFEMPVSVSPLIVVVSTREVGD